jgi:hypothetical protein
MPNYDLFKNIPKMMAVHAHVGIASASKPVFTSVDLGL